MNNVDKNRVADSVMKASINPPEKALEALRERRLVRLFCRRGGELAELYVFYGKDRNYIMIPRTFCSCKDFELNVVSRRLRATCYHLVSLELAISQNKVRVMEVDCDTLENIFLELLLGEYSITLKRILQTGNQKLVSSSKSEENV